MKCFYKKNTPVNFGSKESTSQWQQLICAISLEAFMTLFLKEWMYVNIGCEHSMIFNTVWMSTQYGCKHSVNGKNGIDVS